MAGTSQPNPHEIATIVSEVPPLAAAEPSDQFSTITSPSASPGAGRPLQYEFGDYEILHEVARGGMGVVYKARQKNLDRVVALKMLLPGRLGSEEDKERFLREAEATARLQHPNIVRVYEVGEVHGQYFYSMDFIDGPSLAKLLTAGPLSARVAARYVKALAEAMHHAHTHGILHRDLKPSNIMLDCKEVPHITDFGLAKKLGCDSSHTRTGEILGTPSYMSPEQAAGKARELGPSCDIYGLGAILYEALTGRPPFRSETPLDTMMHVIEKEPAPPRLLNPKIDRDLETICLKCLEKDPSHRYPSALALSEDLNRYLNGEAIIARASNVIARLARTLDRSHHALEFRSWGTMLFWFGIIVFLGNLANFLLLEFNQPKPLRWCATTAKFALMGLLFWRYRGGRTFLPTSSAERQLWTIWIGYMAAFLFAVLVGREILDSPELIVFPYAAILTGFAFFVMGSHFWGRFYLVGAAFFALAVLMPVKLQWAPLEFGTLWLITFLAMGLYLRRLAREQEASDPS